MNNKRIHELLRYLGCAHKAKVLIDSKLGKEDFNDIELEALLPMVEELLFLIKEELIATKQKNT